MVNPFPKEEFTSSTGHCQTNNNTAISISSSRMIGDRSSSDDLQNTTTISQVNEDCIAEICDQLSLNDIIGFSMTCSLFKEIIERYSIREFKAATMSIKMTSNKIKIGLDKSYRPLERFLPGISSLTIYGENKTIFSEVANHFKNLKRLQFKSNEHITKITEQHGNALQNILRNIEAIAFKGNAFTSDYGQHILRYCFNMKHLSIEANISKFRDPQSHRWFQRIFPELVHLQLEFGLPAAIQCDELVQLFLNNENLQHLTIASNVEDTIHFLLNKNIKLDKFSIKITKENLYTFYETVCLLNTLYERQLVNRFEIILSDLNESYKLLNILNGIESIYLLNEFSVQTLSHFNVMFSKLKVLHVEYLSREVTNILCQMTKNLQNLYIDYGDINVLKMFAENLPNLSKMTIKNLFGNIETFSWKMLEKKRTSMNYAQRLYVYLNENAYNDAVKFGAKVLNDRWIIVKRIDSLVPYEPCSKKY